MDWCSQLQRNQARTRWVIIIFTAFYLAVGLLIDLYLNMQNYPQAPINLIFEALLTFQLIPYATVITGVITIFSLLVTFLLYDRIMLLGTEYYEITPQTARSLEEKQLYNVVEELKIAAGLRYIPRIYVIEADYMNAFASGYSEKSAMVAITRGLIHKLDRRELQAVMAHELSHIRHGDIKLTLTASVLSNILLIAIDLLFYNSVLSDAQSNSANENKSAKRSNQNLVFIVVALRYLLPIVTVLLTLYLSRTREYMADAGCVELMRDNQPLASALLKIHQDHQQNTVRYAQAYGQTAHEDVRRAAYLYDPVKTGVEPIKSIASLFATHPTIEERLAALGIKVR